VQAPCFDGLRDVTLFPSNAVTGVHAVNALNAVIRAYRISTHPHTPSTHNRVYYLVLSQKGNVGGGGGSRYVKNLIGGITAFTALTAYAGCHGCGLPATSLRTTFIRSCSDSLSFA
jgi:hypothetical protein